MSGAIKAAVKALAGAAVRDYRVNWIYACTAPPASAAPVRAVPVDEAICRQLEASENEQSRKAARYFRNGLAGLAIMESGAPGCVTHFATPAQYERAGTWPLAPGDLALMDIVTEPHARGKGHALRLIEDSARAMLMGDCRRLVCFIWWSNKPSFRAFEKAGWRRIGVSLEWTRGGPWRALHIPLVRG